MVHDTIEQEYVALINALPPTVEPYCYGEQCATHDLTHLEPHNRGARQLVWIELPPQPIGQLLADLGEPSHNSPQPSLDIDLKQLQLMLLSMEDTQHYLSLGIAKMKNSENCTVRGMK